MNRTAAEKAVAAYLKPIFGFAIRRCKSPQDAEDLSQEIVLRAFQALEKRDDIADVSKFIWTIAHNALSNYYRQNSRCVTGIAMDELEALAAEEPEENEAVWRLQSEIACLSKTQRRIVIAYYFENRAQAEIARELGIPLGTVKWHLFEAKKELKRGIKTMRETEELKFRPIRFAAMSINGSVGSRSIDEFFRSALSQNICYCVRNQAMTVNEIADALGVSPVYVESEVEALEEYGYLTAKKDKYIVNFLIAEPTTELLIKQDRMYKRAARLFAGELFDELSASDLLDDERVICGQTDGPIERNSSPRGDHNFLLWALIPYITARSGERSRDRRISFDQVATVRPDGSQNIFTATVEPDQLALPEDYVRMEQWSGPMWCSNGRRGLWRIDNEWTDRGERKGILFGDECNRVISLYENEGRERFSRDDYAWLGERGLVKTNGDWEGTLKAVWQIVILADKEIEQALFAVGERVRARYQAELDALKKDYAGDLLRAYPAHLRRVKEYELQFLFHSDGCFLFHCLTDLVKTGRLILPTENQRKALCTVIMPG